MTKKIKVLVFPCGAENAIEIHEALRYSVHVELYGASSVDDHGRFAFERYFGGLPNIRDPHFDDAFATLLDRLGIDMVFATHDTVIEYLAARREKWRAHLVNGDPASTALTRRKSLTYARFADLSWAPRVFDSPENVSDWPAVVKPDLGQGAQGVTIVRSGHEARLALERVSEPLLVEYLPGDELTVDCFTDRKRNLIWAGPRTRERLRAGIAMRSRLQGPMPEIEAIAREINDRVLMRGPWFFQVKADAQGRWKLLEISSRVAGTMVAQRARGINLPLMAVQDFKERDLVPLVNAHVKLVERCIATRAELSFDYDTVFIDLDDTLVIDGHAVPSVIAFVYQSVRQGHRVVLITRHAFDIEATLKAARIDRALFDEIVHLDAYASKGQHVTPNAIFVDNHFPERREVHERTGVPVFDVDAVRLLLR
ncbi:ATP-grasp domain-containing protein [Paraburkholderia sp. J76]|uniref:ATP-grasp domain-containing protein n=1 Tax=Paraburkholderia sp. J76 TaxID=2805439 RepID=UPI002ABD5E17|nr:ATP-grasp domain-containing protein [Paraburkholderia sp. J76]